MEKSVAPSFNSRDMNCLMCGEKMFYSPENLVHVCLKTEHGIIAYFEPDSCWFAAEESTTAKLKEKGVKFHFIPKSVFENGGISANLDCEYNSERRV